MAVALFFLSCQDDVTLLGYKNPNSKFKVHYVEIPLESDVYRLDSIITSNASGLPRVLIGNYNDPMIGTVSTAAFIELFHAAALPDTVKNDIVYDSVSLHLRFDYYSYGASGVSDQIFSVHELFDPISLNEDIRNAGLFYSKKDDVDFVAEPIGTDKFSVDNGKFKAQFDKAAAEKDTAILKIRLDDSYGELLISRLRIGGTDLTDQSKFINFVPGLTIQPAASNNKIVGFDHLNSLDLGSNQSRVVLYYHRNGQTRVREASFNFSSQISYSHIAANFINDLSQITDFYQPVKPPTYRYAQTGTGVTTRIDFANFFAFADTVGTIIINSAELAIDGFEPADPYYPINNFNMYVLDSATQVKYRLSRTLYTMTITNTGGIPDTTFLPYTHPWDAAVFRSYSGTITGTNGVYTPIADDNGGVSLKRDGTKLYSYMTLLAQQLYLHKPEERFRFYGLRATDPAIGKTVNRLIFNKNNLKLRIYYTIPTVNQ